MSNLARAWAEKQTPGAGCQMHLLEVIAAYHSDDLGFCTASNRYLANRMRKSEATIERGLKGLEDCGLIRRDTTRWGPDGGARRRISLKNYCPVAMQRELDERKALAKARRAEKRASAAPGRSPHSEGEVPSFCGPGPLSLGGSESLAESLDNYSDPGGSAPQGGAEPGRDFRKDLFDRGARTVQRLTGRSMAKCRALIGSWLRIVDDEAATVLAAIDMAEEGELAEPTAWIGAQLHAAARRAGFGPKLQGGKKRWRNGALELLSDAMRLPKEGEPGYDEWYRNYLHKTFGTPLPQDAQPPRRPVDVTPRDQRHAAQGGQRVANGAIGLFLKRMDGRLVGEPPAAPKEPPTAVIDAYNTKAMAMAKRGEWPAGGQVFVERDAAEGRAWEEYFARFGTRPRWLSLDKGVGAYMPAPWPPAAAETVGDERCS